VKRRHGQYQVDRYAGGRGDALADRKRRVRVLVASFNEGAGSRLPGFVFPEWSKVATDVHVATNHHALV